jgi:hypothetical protein
MIDNDTFLTAAHCVTDWSPDPANDHFYVSLDQDVQSELDAAQAAGGPNFVTIDGALVLAATTITGDTPCYATNVSFRTDTPTAWTFLAPHVALP